MRRAIGSALLAGLFATSSSACPPDPATSFAMVTSAPAFPCHWNFQLDGSRDVLGVEATLLDAAGDPVAGCEATATFALLGGTAFACPAEGFQVADSDADGKVSFTFATLGGAGVFGIIVSSGFFSVELGPFTMTSPDLNGDDAVTVIDLGIFAGCLSPDYCPAADYNCDGVVNVVDLGRWAGGLGTACP